MYKRLYGLWGEYLNCNMLTTGNAVCVCFMGNDEWAWWILALSNYNLSWSCALYKTCWHTDTHRSIHMCNAGSTWTPTVPLKPSVKFKSVPTGATPPTQMQLDKAAIELESGSHFLELLQRNIRSSNLQRPVCENYPKIFIGNSWIWKAEKGLAAV